jgi:hypothetical protein
VAASPSERQARGDRSAQECAVRPDGVDGRGGSAIGDHDRATMEPVRGEGIHQPIGAHLPRSIDPDGERQDTRSGHEHRSLAAPPDGLDAVADRRHNGRRGDRLDIAPARIVEPEQAAK